MKQIITILLLVIPFSQLSGQNLNAFRIIDEYQQTKIDKSLHYNNIRLSENFIHENKKADFSLRSGNIALDSIVTLNFQNTDEGENDDKTIFHYNAEKQNTSRIHYNWNSEGEWEAVLKYDYDYYEDNRLKSRTRSTFTNEGNWEADDSYVFDYDNEGRITSLIIKSFIASLNDWYESHRVEYYYAFENEYEEIINFTKAYGEDEWLYSTKEVYVRDDLDRIERTENYSWSRDNEEWSIFYKAEYDYNHPGNQFDIINYLLIDMVWVKNRKASFDYNENNAPLSIFYYDWDTSIDYWVDDYQFFYGYDEYFNQSSYMRTYWDEIHENYFVVFESRVNHDYSIEPSELIVPEIYSSFHKIESKENWKSVDFPENLVLQKIDNYFYSDFTSKTIDNLNGQEIYVYPNPVKNLLRVYSVENHDYSELQIFDASGILTESINLSKQKKIDVKGWAPGIYSIRFIGPNNQKTGLILKLK